MVEPELRARGAEGTGDVAAAVVGEQAATRDPTGDELGDRALQEGGAARAVVRAEHLDVGRV